MKKFTFNVCLILACVFLLPGAYAQSGKEMSLKQALDGKFYIGTAMNGFQIRGRDTASVELIKTQFNSVVAENVMKSGVIQPREGEFKFELPDQFVAFAQQHDMYTVGHCLVWHSQAPRWFFTDDQGNEVSREVLIERIKTHIYTVAGRYRGKVDCWDVVNEAFEDDGSWRNNKFYQIIGPEYVELAFRFAHEADPDAELLYNDYSMFHKGRRDAVVALVKDLRAKGLRIDGVGMQAHYAMDYPDFDDFEASIVAFGDAGVDVHITEMDLSVLPFPDQRVGADVRASFEYQEKMNPYADGLPEEVQKAWHDRYLNFFRIFLKHQDIVKRVTLWGVSDRYSWKNNWPIRGRTDYPLLFDRAFQPKPVVADIIREATQ